MLCWSLSALTLNQVSLSQLTIITSHSLLENTTNESNVILICFLETKSPKKSNKAALKDWSKKSSVKAERVNYTAEFIVDSDFGVPGAIAVTNKHQREFFLESIVIEGFAIGAVHFPCNSWVQGERIFFSNKVTNLERSKHLITI